jgi:hypothetical protein
MTEPAELSADLHHEEAHSLAERFGWHHKHEEHGLAEQWTGVPFGHGEHKKVHNVMRASHNGRDFTAFDYRFVVFSDSNVDSSDRNAVHRYLVTVIPLSTSVPVLSASEGTYTHWEPAGSRLNVAHDRFGDHYDVHGEDQAFADAVLDPEWMTQVLHRMRRTEWRFAGNELIGWAKDQNVAHQLEDVLDVLCPLASRAEQAAS